MHHLGVGADVDGGSEGGEGVCSLVTKVRDASIVFL